MVRPEAHSLAWWSNMGQQSRRPAQTSRTQRLRGRTITRPHREGATRAPLRHHERGPPLPDRSPALVAPSASCIGQYTEGAAAMIVAVRVAGGLRRFSETMRSTR